MEQAISLVKRINQRMSNKEAYELMQEVYKFMDDNKDNNEIIKYINSNAWLESLYMLAKTYKDFSVNPFFMPQ